MNISKENAKLINIIQIHSNAFQLLRTRYSIYSIYLESEFIRVNKSSCSFDRTTLRLSFPLETRPLSITAVWCNLIGLTLDVIDLTVQI